MISTFILKLIQISKSEFYKCCELASITLNEGIKTIGNYAFQYCNSLKTI
ncbi:MAG: leucine-rich repeat protein, partial [Prevotella sp.]|nr:leucine-rich repeat protein [Prevotella sp.]